MGLKWDAFAEGTARLGSPRDVRTTRDGLDAAVRARANGGTVGASPSGLRLFVSAQFEVAMSLIKCSERHRTPWPTRRRREPACASSTVEAPGRTSSCSQRILGLHVALDSRELAIGDLTFDDDDLGDGALQEVVRLITIRAQAGRFSRHGANACERCPRRNEDTLRSRSLWANVEQRCRSPNRASRPGNERHECVLFAARASRVGSTNCVRFCRSWDRPHAATGLTVIESVMSSVARVRRAQGNAYFAFI